MRLDGERMLFGKKDIARFACISVIVLCAVLVCGMFLNYYLDIRAIEPQIVSPLARIFYDAQCSTAIVVCAVSGGCLLLTSLVMLLFFIKYFIDTHKPQLGVLKAMGYPSIRIAKRFWVFGLSVLLGAVLGLCGAYALMPEFYRLQNADKLLPDIPIGFHPGVMVGFTLVPAAAFAALAVLYACKKLEQPVLLLLKDGARQQKASKKRNVSDDPAQSFLAAMRKNALRSKKSLAFFIWLSAFCFSSMTQMSFSMRELSSEMMGAMMLLIGLTLACVTLFLAIATVVRGSAKPIAMMRVLGYSRGECASSTLGAYRPIAYAGFAVGTVYQYALLRVMVDIVFRDVAGVPAYSFDTPMMFLSLGCFAAAYELVMYACARRIGKAPLKQVMLEE